MVRGTVERCLSLITLFEWSHTVSVFFFIFFMFSICPHCLPHSASLKYWHDGSRYPPGREGGGGGREMKGEVGVERNV